jgi:peptidoglycan/xylan/chitin deacetylase (PgdA/CDA1 family)
MTAALAGIGVVFAGLAGFFIYACTIPSSKLFRPVLTQGPGRERYLALTFDDGPASPFTEQILDILKERKVPATFFVCGQNVERYPEIVRRIHREGHTLGNHTYSHPFLYFKTSRRIAEEIDRTQTAVKRAAGVRPTLFRPPYGGRWFGLMPVLAERDLKMVMWSATGYDWKNGREQIVNSTLQEINPGSVILLHDGRNVSPPEDIDRSSTVASLPIIIDRAVAAEYKFVSLYEFLEKS